MVTYVPDPEVGARLDLIRDQVQRLIIVDNGSADKTVTALRDYADRTGATLIANPRNAGIAAALNTGIAAAAAEGFDWVLTMDQDSALQPGCVAALITKAAADVALVGSNRREAVAGAKPHRWVRPARRVVGFERARCEQLTDAGVTLVISSGTLTNVAAYREAGPLREDFFIDMVDSEYCLRVHRLGYRIVVACAAHLDHRVGAKTPRPVGPVTLVPTHHSAVRRYYLFRNATVTLRAYGRSVPHWATYQVLALLEVLAGIVLFESGKMAKLRAAALGVWDGVRGRLGPVTRELGS